MFIFLNVDGKKPNPWIFLDNGLVELNEYLWKTLVRGPTKNNFWDKKNTDFENFW